MKNTISAGALSFLLEISKKDANNKIIAFKERKLGNNADMLEESIMVPDPKDPEKKICKYSKNESADIEELEGYLNLPISFAIKNIRDKSIRSKSTFDRIVSYPSSKIVPNKKTGKLPLSVSMPDYYKELLTPEDLNTIIDLWKSNYPAFVRQGGVFTL